MQKAAAAYKRRYYGADCGFKKLFVQSLDLAILKLSGELEDRAINLLKLRFQTTS
nr:MAG TPA: hypothetical protein [Caudoviricetes sp.]